MKGRLALSSSTIWKQSHRRLLAWVVPSVVAVVAIVLTVAHLVGGSAGVSEPRHVLYLEAPATRVVLSEASATLGARALASTYRQGPDREELVPPARRLGKVDASQVSGLRPEQIAARLTGAIERGGCGRQDCDSHLVAFDDVNLEHRGPPGAALSSAMKLLDRPSPWGGSYAERMQLYVDVDAFLDLSRRQGAARWASVGPALAQAGGVWIETYRSTGPGRVGSLSRQQWIAGTQAIADVMRAFGGTTSRLHFLFGPDPPPQGLAKATATSLNRLVLCNGSGAFQMSSAEALGWLRTLRGARNVCQ
jgi:hypothetical protein